MSNVMMIRLLAILLMTPAALSAPAAQPEKPPPQRPSIAIKTVEPAWLTYREFTGPYWRTGPALEQVRAYMARHGLSGTMFTRFPASPTDPATAGKPAWIGFITTDRHTPMAPFKRTLLNAGPVATMTIEHAAGASRRGYEAIFTWIDQQGREPLGPVMEIYRPAESRPDRFEVEIQVMLKPAPGESPAVPTSPDRPVVAEPSAASPATPSTRPSVTARPPPVGQVETEPEQPAVIDQTNRAPERDEPPARPQATPPTPPAGAAASTDEPAETDPTDARKRPPQPWMKPPPTTKRDPAPATAPSPRATDPSPQPAEPSAPATGTTAPPAQPSQTVRPIRGLVAAGEFDRIAMQLMPPELEIPASMQVWFGQAIFRLGAVAKAVDRFYPETETAVPALVGAIRNRYREFSSTFRQDPLSQAVVRVDVHAGGERARQQRQIMRDLDQLLARLAVRAIDPETTETQVIDIVESLHALMRETAADDEATTGSP